MIKKTGKFIKNSSMLRDLERYCLDYWTEIMLSCLYELCSLVDQELKKYNKFASILNKNIS